MQHYQSRRTFDYRGNKQRFQINHAKSKVNTLPEQPEAPEQARKLMLEVMGQPIRSKGELFSANDLHKIAGGEKHKAPNEWLRTNQAQELINEVTLTGNFRLAHKVVKGGKEPGVWLCEDLMYSYAMWLSPRFQLLVIRCFKEYAQAMITRYKLRGESLELNEALLLRRKEIGKDTKFYHYANEYKMLNRVLLGMPMDRFMKLNGIPKGKVRDYLQPEQLRRLDKLIGYDMTLVDMGYSYAEREEALIKMNDRLIERARLELSPDSDK